jgi:hypothetical protein
MKINKENEILAEETSQNLNDKTRDKKVNIVKSGTIENLETRISEIENFLKKEIRSGFNEIGYIPYNALQKSAGKFYGGNENPNTNSTAYRLNYDGRFYATQLFAKAFFYTSDINEKHNIQDLENALEKVLGLRGVSFNWNDDNTEDAGLIAQEVKEVIPEAVEIVDDKHSIKVSTLIAYLVKSIHQLKDELDAIKNGKDFDKK